MNLYGGRWAFVDTPEGSHLCIPCYYCTYSDFYRYTSLDCVILHAEDGCVLMPNTYSSRLDVFRQSCLYKDFEKHSAIWSPEVLEEAGEALCLKGKVNIKDACLVFQHLSLQYPKHKIRFVDLNAYGGVMKVDNNRQNKNNLRAKSINPQNTN
jgi:hypothetical protein